MRYVTYIDYLERSRQTLLNTCQNVKGDKEILNIDNSQGC